MNRSLGSRRSTETDGQEVRQAEIWLRPRLPPKSATRSVGNVLRCSGLMEVVLDRGIRRRGVTEPLGCCFRYLPARAQHVPLQSTSKPPTSGAICRDLRIRTSNTGTEEGDRS
jgi:hypothetical protein